MKNRLAIFTLLAALAALALVVAGCSDDDSPSEPGGGGGTDPGTGSVSGVVSGVSGWPFSGATVTVGDASAATNEQGYFVLSGVPEGETLVAVTADGYLPTFRVVEVVEGGDTHLDDLVLALWEVATLDAATGGQVATNDGDGAVTFAADSFVDAAGNAYDGEVTVQLNAVLPGDAEFYGTFPGDFEGVRENGDTVPFVSFGFMGVELTGVDKSPLQLADGATASLSLTIDPGKAMDAPATIPMWWFDEDAGVWREEGAATLEGNVYTADVAHFTTWNWDLPLDDVCSITGVVRTDTGNTVEGARVVSRGVDMAIMDEALTDGEGRFTVRAVKNSLTDVWAIMGSLASEPVRVTVGEECPVVLTDPLVLTVPAYTISLTWGAEPSDLDSHLLIPMTWDTAFDYYHIYYSSMGTLGADPYAMLDTDDTSSYGPEIITGTQLYDGRFQYWVYNWSGDDSAELQASGAMVVLSAGGRQYVYEAADVSLEGADLTGWWHVFDMVVAGGVVSVEPVMEFQPEFSYDGVYEGDKGAAK